MIQRILLSIGSNFEAPQHIRAAIKELSQLFPGMTFTRPVWTDPVGHAGPKYLNVLAKGETRLSYDDLEAAVKAAEIRLGRLRQAAGHRVAVDIDILQIGKERYHLSDWQRSYVLLLLDKPYFLSDEASSFITPST